LERGGGVRAGGILFASAATTAAMTPTSTSIPTPSGRSPCTG
jgi:hypothetical protein